MSTPLTILVTGASRGLGLAIASDLLGKGYGVIALSRQRTKAIEALAEKHSGLIRWVEFDLSSPAEMTTEWFQQVVTQKQPIHGLVNNAAVAYDDLVTNLELDSLENQMRINVTSPMILTKMMIRQMLLHQVGGSIVHISSISTQQGYKGLAMYAATKGAIEAFSKNTAKEWGPRKIRSNCVVPGFMPTEMSSGLDHEVKERIFNRTSLKESTSIESVAATVAFLLSDDSRSITGQNIIVDAGTI
jgi:3-oxoacyl-[acyl-carrier protein] reductase